MTGLNIVAGDPAFVAAPTPTPVPTSTNGPEPAPSATATTAVVQVPGPPAERGDDGSFLGGVGVGSLVVIMVAAAAAGAVAVRQRQERERARTQQDQQRRLDEQQRERQRLVEREQELAALRVQQREQELAAEKQREAERKAEQNRQQQQQEQAPAPTRQPLVGAFETVLPDLGSEAVRDKLRRALEAAAGPDSADTRAQLIQTCIEVCDMVRTPDVLTRLRTALLESGVAAIEPDGQRFDPHVHEAIGAEDTTDPALHELIERTVYAGYRDSFDGGRVLRDPRVIVYTLST